MEFDFKVKCIIAVRRFFELLLAEVLLSVAVTLLSVLGLGTSGYTVIISVGLGVLFFFGMNIWQMRSCFFDLRDYKLHYALNFIGYFAFAAVNLIALLVLPNVPYTWLFALTKCVRYILPSVTSLYSALIFHAVGLLTVLLSPIGMSWLLDIPDTNPYEYK